MDGETERMLDVDERLAILESDGILFAVLVVIFVAIVRTLARLRGGIPRLLLVVIDGP